MSWKLQIMTHMATEDFRCWSFVHISERCKTRNKSAEQNKSYMLHAITTCNFLPRILDKKLEKIENKIYRGLRQYLIWREKIDDGVLLGYLEYFHTFVGLTLFLYARIFHKI